VPRRIDGRFFREANLFSVGYLAAFDGLAGAQEVARMTAQAQRAVRAGPGD